MTKTLTPPGTLSRRGLLTGAGGGAAGLALGALRPGHEARAHASAPPPRIFTRGRERQRAVVIGAGVAGVAAAWLLNDEFDVVLLEADSELGGHARSLDVEVNGKTGVVDAGAQYFGPRTHPAYWRLLKDILQIPVVATPMDLTMGDAGVEKPRIVSPHSPDRLSTMLDPSFWPALAAMGVMVYEANKLEKRADWTPTLEKFIDGLTLTHSMKYDFLLPLLASTGSAPISAAKTASARSMLAFVVRPLGSDPLAPFDYYNAESGLRSVVRAFERDFSTVTSHVNAAAARLSRDGDDYLVEDVRGGQYRADHIVLALPPYAAGPLVGQLAGTGSLSSIFARFPYFATTVAIHKDPIYMPKEQKWWSTFNCERDGDYCEGSMAYGIMRGLDVYKSWVAARREQPKELIASYDYKHPINTPDSIRAQGHLALRQGDQRLWFAGSHCIDVDSQESALWSAVLVAERLAPGSKNLARVKKFPEFAAPTFK
jgi:predicted NAD/FAD-binding protein